MKELKKGTLCEKCLGCNKLLIENFTGSYKCFNFVKGEKTNDNKNTFIMQKQKK